MEKSNNNNYNNSKFNPILLPTEFQINNLRVKPLEEPKTKDGKPSAQKYGYIMYEHKPNTYSGLSLQTNKFPIIGNGLPSKQYMNKDIKELAQYKLPLSVLNMEDIKNTNNDDYYNDVLQFEKAMKPLADIIKSIDSYLSDDENKKKLFGDEYSKYNYLPLYKEVDVEEIKNKSKLKNNDNSKVYAICDYLKLRFKCKFIENEDFEVFSKSYNNEDGQNKELGNLRFDDLKKYLKFRNNVVFVIDFQKLYANKAASGNGKDKKKNYGVILQINMMNIYSKPKSSFVKEFRNEEVKNEVEEVNDEVDEVEEVEEVNEVVKETSIKSSSGSKDKVDKPVEKPLEEKSKNSKKGKK